MEQRSDWTLASLALGNRAHRALARSGVGTVAELLNRSGAEVVRLRGMGAACLTELERALEGRATELPAFQAARLEEFLGELRQVPASAKYVRPKPEKKVRAPKPPAEPAPPEGRRHPSNKLNHLTGKEWIRFTRSWFVENPPRRKQSLVLHPAKYPESLATQFIEFFTKRNELVLDPFMGVGSTVLAAAQTGRRGVGTELNERYFLLAREHLGLLADLHHLFHADAADIAEIFAREGLGEADFVLTSPPYWDMLANSRGNVVSVHRKRQAQGLDVVYSNDPRDLGNLAEYSDFLDQLTAVFRNVVQVVRSGGYLVIVVQNLRNPDGSMVPLAWDLCARLREFLVFKGERIWCQDNKPLGIWGYPSEFVTNVHHHYCLIFRRP